MNNDRLIHSISVARKMVEIGKSKKLSNRELEDLFLLGFNHDIGYEFTINGKDHGIIGGNILKNNNYKYWKEVYYHGRITDEYESLFLLILNQADMQIDKYGNDVGYDARLDDIKSRYGEDSKIYNYCQELVKMIRDK